MSSANPLLDLGFHIPFDRIEAAHVEPAVDALLEGARAAIAALGAATDPPTYANTLAAAR